MDDEERQRQALSFGPVAEVYDRGRPSFPAEAVRWLVGEQPATVLELGAGTGKLTSVLVEQGHDVHATDPDPAMLEVLRRHLPDVPTSESGAEEIPLPDRSVDVVVAGQAFHWFDHERALPEIARVLRPGGHVALAWNNRDERIPWVRKLWQILGDQPQLTRDTESSVEAVVRSDLFGFVDETKVQFWQDVNRESIVDLVVSRSYVSTLDDDVRAETLERALALYDDYGRGMDGMQLSYNCECFRAQVVERLDDPPPGGSGSTGEEREVGPDHGDDTDARRVSDGGDSDVLLIDFR